MEIGYFSREMKITFEMSCKNDDIPFDYLYFSEYYTFENITNKIYYKDIPIKKEGDRIIASFIYKLNHTPRKYLYIRFTPKYNLSYFIPQYDV